MSRKSKRNKKKRHPDGGTHPPRFLPLLPECPPHHVGAAEPFLAAVCASPDDDLPRLVFADWLEELQEPWANDRGELIRLGCHIATIPGFLPSIERLPDIPDPDLKHTPAWMHPPEVRSLLTQEAEALKRVVAHGGYVRPPGSGPVSAWEGGWEVHSHLGTALAPRSPDTRTPGCLNVRGFPGVLWSPLNGWAWASDRVFPCPFSRWEVPDLEPVACRFTIGADFTLEGTGPASAYRGPGGLQVGSHGRAFWGFTGYDGFLGEPSWEPYMLTPVLLDIVAGLMGTAANGAGEGWTFDEHGDLGVYRRAAYQRANGSGMLGGDGYILLVYPVEAVVFPYREVARDYLAQAMGFLSGVGQKNPRLALAAMLPSHARGVIQSMGDPTDRAEPTGGPTLWPNVGHLDAVTALWTQTARSGAHFPPQYVPEDEVNRVLNPLGLLAATDVDPVVSFHPQPDDGDDAWDDDTLIGDDPEEDDEFDGFRVDAADLEPYLGSPEDQVERPDVGDDIGGFPDDLPLR